MADHSRGNHAQAFLPARSAKQEPTLTSQVLHYMNSLSTLSEGSFPAAQDSDRIICSYPISTWGAWCRLAGRGPELCTLLCMYNRHILEHCRLNTVARLVLVETTSCIYSRCQLFLIHDVNFSLNIIVRIWEDVDGYRSCQLRCMHLVLAGNIFKWDWC